MSRAARRAKENKVPEKLERDIEAAEPQAGAGAKEEGSNLDDKPTDKVSTTEGNDERSGLLGEVAEDKGPKRQRAPKPLPGVNTSAGGGAADGDEDIENQKNSVSLGPLRVLEPVRQDPIKALVGRQKRLERLPAEGIPEVHYVGQISSGQGMLEDTTEGVSIRWRIDTGKAWQLLGGEIQGQTQVSYCKARETENVPFNHPIDVHFAEAGLQGWGAPRISFQAYRLDWTGRRILVGYGFEHMPTAPGPQKMKVNLWRPTGSAEQELEAYLLGRTPALVNHEPIYDSAWRERCRLVTVPAGSINMEIFCMTRNLAKVGIDQRPAK